MNRAADPKSPAQDTPRQVTPLNRATTHTQPQPETPETGLKEPASPGTPCPAKKGRNAQGTAKQPRVSSRCHARPHGDRWRDQSRQDYIIPPEALDPTSTEYNSVTAGGRRLSVAQRTALLVDHAAGLTFNQLQAKYGISRGTVDRWIDRNRDRIEAIKQDLAARCLSIAARAQAAITDEKLRATSAAQLTTIARESTYTATMLMQGKIPGTGSTNLTQIILETGSLASGKSANNNAVVIEVGKTGSEKTQNDANNEDKTQNHCT